MMMMMMVTRRLTMTMEAPHNKKSERNGGTSAARGRVWGNFDFWSADLVIIGNNLFSELQFWISSVARFQDSEILYPQIFSQKKLQISKNKRGLYRGVRNIRERLKNMEFFMAFAIKRRRTPPPFLPVKWH